MDGGREHFRGFLPIRFVIAEARDDARLVVVAPEERVPAAARRHLLLPVGKELLELVEVRRHERPLVAILVIDLQVMEAERHGEFVLRGIRVADAAADGRRAHLADRHHAVDAGIVHKLLKIFVHVRAVRVVFAAVARRIVLERALADEVHDVETEPLDATRFPEAEDVLELFAHGGILPVEIGLRDVEKMEVRLVKTRYILPRRAAEL